MGVLLNSLRIFDSLRLIAFQLCPHVLRKPNSDFLKKSRKIHELKGSLSHPPNRADGFRHWRTDSAIGGRIGEPDSNFLMLFIFSGIISDLPTTFRYRDDPSFRSVGASGAISGIMFSYVLFYPLENLYLYGIIPIPGIIAGILYLWYSNHAAKKEGGRIDHNAHFFGAVSGLVITILLYPPVILSFFRDLMSVF